MQEIPELCLRGKTARSWPNLSRVHPKYLLKDSLDGKRVTAFTPSLLALHQIHSQVYPSLPQIYKARSGRRGPSAHTPRSR